MKKHKKSFNYKLLFKVIKFTVYPFLIYYAIKQIIFFTPFILSLINNFFIKIEHFLLTPYYYFFDAIFDLTSKIPTPAIQQINENLFNNTQINIINELQVISIVLFITGLSLIIFNRLNLIIALMGIELMLLGCNVNFIVTYVSCNDYSSQIYVFIILTISAIETAIGISILVLFYSVKKTASFENLNSLKR